MGVVFSLRYESSYLLFLVVVCFFSAVGAYPLVGVTPLTLFFTGRDERYYCLRIGLFYLAEMPILFEACFYSSLLL